MNKEHLHPNGRPYTKEEFVKKIKTDKKFSERFGNLGKIYGYQWRNWNSEIDQIANAINLLKTDPDSRRNRVSAWNVGELDQMVLPPCHTDFQFYTRELSREERIQIYVNQYMGGVGKPAGFEDAKLTTRNIPTRAISLMWNQRSVDTFLGLPFNIASYGLLLEIIAKLVNMVPDELIGNLGDTHLYSNHIVQAKEQISVTMTTEERMSWWFQNNKPNRNVCDVLDQLTDFAKNNYFDNANVPKQKMREGYTLPTLNINLGMLDSALEKYEINMFKLENYQSHPEIKAPLSN